jgi:hypothetical protein
MKTQHVSFRFAPEIYRVLDAIKQRDGIPISEQMRRAVLLWIDKKMQPEHHGSNGIGEDGIPLADLVAEMVQRIRTGADGRATSAPRRRRQERLRRGVTVLHD